MIKEVDVELERRKLHKKLLEGGMRRRRVHAARTYNMDDDEQDKRHGVRSYWLENCYEEHHCRNMQKIKRMMNSKTSKITQKEDRCEG